MENVLQSFPSLFSFLIFVILMFLKARKKSTIAKSTPNLPPGPWRLPFIGNLHQLICGLPHRRMRDLAIKYGPLMYLQLGEVPHIIVSSPETAKEITKTHDVNFAQRPRILAAGKYYGLDIVFGVYGDYWRMLKKICTEELLSHKRVQSFRSIREDEATKLIEDLRSNSGFPVNLTSKVFSMMYVITSRAAFGKKCKDQEVFLSSVNEALKLAGGFSAFDVFPSRKWLHWIDGVSTKFGKVVETMDRVLEGIIIQRKADKAATNEVNGTACLLDVLLELEGNGNLAFPLETEHIKAIILDMFVGGSETASTMIEWTMLEMLKNPKVMEKAQAEVRQVFRERGDVAETGLDELKYLKMVIKETLRFHPPGPFIVPRESRESCVINGYYIPAKTRVIISAWAIGRDPRYWEDAERFYPERFVDSSVDFKGNNFELIPFGAGRRICPGISFAMANTELPLAHLLFHFDWKLPDWINHENLDMTESFGMTVRRKEDLYLIPVPYNPTPI